jgi:hypothetical protein
MRRRGWLALILLAPVVVLVIGTQVAALVGLVGVAQTALAGRDRDSAALDAGLGTILTATDILDRTWSSPAAKLLEYNPVTLGAMDDLSASVHALAVGARALEPLAEMGTAAVGFDGEPPIVTGTTIDPLRAEQLAPQVAAVHEALAATGSPLPGSRARGRWEGRSGTWPTPWPAPWPI